MTGNEGMSYPQRCPPFLADGDIECEGSITKHDGKVYDSSVSSWPE